MELGQHKPKVSAVTTYGKPFFPWYRSCALALVAVLTAQLIVVNVTGSGITKGSNV